MTHTVSHKPQVVTRGKAESGRARPLPLLSVEAIHKVSQLLIQLGLPLMSLLFVQNFKGVMNILRNFKKPRKRKREDLAYADTHKINMERRDHIYETTLGWYKGRISGQQPLQRSALNC